VARQGILKVAKGLCVGTGTVQQIKAEMNGAAAASSCFSDTY
jgi:hypothetical protein